MEWPIHSLRYDTPGCSDKIFLDSAGSSLPPRIVNRTMKHFLDKEEKMGGYKLADLNSDAIQEFYSEAASMLNCRADNIAFTYNATDAFSRGLSSLPFREGDVILTTDDDYISNHIAFISLNQRRGVRIKRMKNKPNGEIDVESLLSNIRKERPALVSVTHIPTNSGKIQDVVTIGEICSKEEIYFIVDACQSAGQMLLDVNRIKCDFLSATGRKFLRGPRGTGLLYVSDRILDENLAPLLPDMRGGNWIEDDKYDLYSGARRFEYWEFNYANVLGLKEAIAYGNKLGWNNIWDYNQSLLKDFRDQLSKVPGLIILDQGNSLSNIITWRMEGLGLTETQSLLNDHNIFYSVANIESALIDFTKKGVDWAIRFSPHYFNTSQEAKTTSDILESYKRKI